MSPNEWESLTGRGVPLSGLWWHLPGVGVKILLKSVEDRFIEIVLEIVLGISENVLKSSGREWALCGVWQQSGNGREKI